MAVTADEAERIVDGILSSNEEVLSAGVIDKSGKIINNKSRESFRKRFEVRSLEQNRYSGTLAVAALSIANEVKDSFGEAQALITIYSDCKLMLLPMPSYDLLIGLALESSANAENPTFVRKMERLVTHAIRPY